MSTPSRPRAVLVGLGTTTATALRSLTRELDVAVLVRPGDDGVTRIARDLGVEVVGEASLASLRRAIVRCDPDAVIVSSYDRVLPADLLEGRAFVNVHYSALPRLRGRAVVNWALLLGHAETAITIHTLSAGLDDGALLYQELVPIGERDTVTDLYDRLNAIQERELGRAVLRRLAGDEGRPQVGEPTYAGTRLPSDGLIDWTTDARTIDRLVRSLGGPYPSAYTHLGLTRVSVLAAEPVASRVVWEGSVPGRVSAIDRTSGSVTVFTGAGELRLLRICEDGGTPCAPADLIRSTRTTLGLDANTLLELLRSGAGIPLPGSAYEGATP